MIKTKVSSLCTPAMLYLVISVIVLIPVIIQNMEDRSKYCVGNYACDVPDTLHIFLAKGTYIAFWTFLLNWICSKGYKNASWFILLFPFISMFVMMAMLILNGGI